MFELLEELLPAFTRVIKKRVDLAELTHISLQLSPRQAVVVTNRQVYMLYKGIFGGVRSLSIPLNKIGLVRILGRELLLEGDDGILCRLDFANKRDLQASVYKKLCSLASVLP